MYFLPTSLIFIGYFILTLIYIIKNRKVKIENHLFTNELLIASLFLLAGILYPFIYGFHSPTLSRNSLSFLWFFAESGAHPRFFGAPGRKDALTACPGWLRLGFWSDRTF